MPKMPCVFEDNLPYMRQWRKTQVTNTAVLAAMHLATHPPKHGRGKQLLPGSLPRILISIGSGSGEG